MRTRALLAAAAILLCPCLATAAPDAVPTQAAAASNQFGLDLHRCLAAKPGAGNTLISPLALHSGLTMLADGAAGKTLAELVAALHLGSKPEEMSQAVAALGAELEKLSLASAARAEADRKSADPFYFLPLQFHLASRIYTAKGREFVPEFLETTSSRWHSPSESLDFLKDPEGARQHINAWISDATGQKITSLIPPESVPRESALVLASALYFKSEWKEHFGEDATRPLDFSKADGNATKVATMVRRTYYGCKQAQGFTAVALPFLDEDVHFLLLVPDEKEGLAKLERNVTSDLLGSLAHLPSDPHVEVTLYLPKFKIQAPSGNLTEPLKTLGITSAFSRDLGQADFSRISKVPLVLESTRHQSVVSLDERGMEAADALNSNGAWFCIPPKRITIRADHPFLFAIQHVKSGACLFLGRVTDPKF